VLSACSSSGQGLMACTVQVRSKWLQDLSEYCSQAVVKVFQVTYLYQLEHLAASWYNTQRCCTVNEHTAAADTAALMLYMLCYIEAGTQSYSCHTSATHRQTPLS